MYTTLLLALGSARRSIRITNPYFMLDEAMTEVLLKRVQLGVTVEVIVPGAIDHQLVRQASRATWGDLLKGGVRFFEYRPALLHAKTIVIDGVWATVGSTNLGTTTVLSAWRPTGSPPWMASFMSSTVS